MTEQGSDANLSPDQAGEIDRQYAEHVEAWRKEEAAVAAAPAEDESEGDE